MGGMRHPISSLRGHIQGPDSLIPCQESEGGGVGTGGAAQPTIGTHMQKGARRALPENLLVKPQLAGGGTGKVLTPPLREACCAIEAVFERLAKECNDERCAAVPEMVRPFLCPTPNMQTMLV